MIVKKFSAVYSAELEGIDARLIEVEVDVNVGIHSFNLVGLADKALNEARERVNSALKNSGVKPPNRENRKIIINLAQADVRKTGSQYDLAMALGYLLATKQIAPFETSDKLFLGELALDGRLRPVNGALNVAQMAAERGFKYLFLPSENVNEASAIQNIRVVAIENLRNAIAMLETKNVIEAARFEAGDAIEKRVTPDLSEIVGQNNAKRALTIAAAGGHNLLMVGPPGVGKSFLARAFAGILPALEIDEAIEITKIWSAAGLRPNGLVRERPFRAPHQTTSPIALVGGGREPRPGEISLAHRGVLFLDEIPEFQKNALEGLRQPMESGFIHLSRAKNNFIFPAKFMLVAAMNPCPCGYYSDPERECKCTAYEVIKYQKKISGPLLDRIDLQVKVGKVKIEDLRNGEQGELQTAAAKAAIERARGVQRQRFENETENGSRDGNHDHSNVYKNRGGIKTNAEMTSREVREKIHFDHGAQNFLATLDKSHLSPRGYYRLLKVALTIADLEGSGSISAKHLAEAFSYRIREEV